jgi:hypothetical protein
MSSEKLSDTPQIPEPSPEVVLDESAQPANAPKKSKPDKPKSVEEINESLKAMGSEFGDADVRTLTPEEVKELDAEAESAALAEAPAAEAAEAETQTADETSEEAQESETLEEDDKTENDGLLNDPETEKAIDDIVAAESDAVLAADDLERDLEAASDEEEDRGRFPKWLVILWTNPRLRWALITVGIAGLLLIGILPQSRYFILNTVGVRSSLSLRVVDGGTLQPLKNVTVRAGGASAQTDSEGNTKLEHVRLGSTILQIEKRAFSPIDSDITVGWGSNPLGEFRVSAVGTQYTFFIKDFLSNKPIEKAEASSGDGNATSDQDGKIVLTLDTAEHDDSDQISIEISAGSYRNETVEINVNNKEEQSIDMVPGRKHVLVSKRSGKYDVYTAYVDGKDEQKIVEGTGLERDDITLVPHQKDGIAALVSTRERVMDANGYLLSTLYVVNTQDGELVKIDQSEQIKVIGWADDGHLVYVKIAAGASGTDPKRHRLMSFNQKNYADIKELASSNSFNDVLMAGGRVYYAPSNIFQESSVTALYVVNPDGTNPKTILDKEVFTIVRSNFNTIDLSVGQAWYSYNIGSTESAKLGTAPASLASRVYTDNPANDFSLWVDNRDGKGTLINYDEHTKTDTTLTSHSGLKLPVYWLNDKYVIYRVSDSKETADYVINTEGGEARKITDVTNTTGLGRWFYY